MPAFKSLCVAALAAFTPIAMAQIDGHCDPADIVQPNPITTKYTTQSTGTLNGSHAIVPIPLTQARNLIPAKYPILTKQIKQWLPKLGANSYPLLVSIEKLHDIYHDGKAAGTANDYLRAHVSFPFVDRLNDGYSAMMYTPNMIISNSAGGPKASLKAEGYNASGGYFSSCNAYQYQNGTFGQPPAARIVDQAAWVESNTDFGNPNIAYRLKPVATSPYSINYLYNVTNQPQFSDGTVCTNMVRLYNTDVSLSPYAPVRVYGNATALKGFFTNTKTIWEDVYGYKLDVAYHVGGNVACSSLKGFHVNSAPAS